MYELDTEAPAHDHWQDVAGHRLVRVHASPRLGETLEVAGRIVAQHEPVECIKCPLASSAQGSATAGGCDATQPAEHQQGLIIVKLD
jgi:hypothetical protein